ncbi:hypothetical protein GpartN1_g66.t1 [Galdieria partita]|uniref:GATA-type domain-containing protein n=1 Tax=Galdieria partita TaxID=83374 RepID=A0A9C7UM14_9RHOD|nr:hypothetical protein GpartN1_g66.t1 [Galdieria partita]
MTSQDNLVSVSSVTSLTANLNADMNFLPASAYWTQNPATNPVTQKRFPLVVCLRNPLNIPNLSTSSSKFELFKNTEVCQSQTAISVSRLLEQCSPVSKPSSNSKSQVLHTEIQDGKHSITAVPDISHYAVATTPAEIALSRGSSDFFEGYKFAGDCTNGSFRKNLKASKECSNCHQTHSPNWYLSKEKLPLCNACAKYQKRTGLPRPPQHWNKELRLRKRKIDRLQHMTLEACKVTDNSATDRGRVECNDCVSHVSVNNVTVTKLRKKQESSEISCLWKGDQKKSFDSDTENNILSMNSKQTSPRRSKLFEMEQNMRHYQSFGNWDKMTSLLSVVQLAKYEGDFVLTL